MFPRSFTLFLEPKKLIKKKMKSLKYTFKKINNFLLNYLQISSLSKGIETYNCFRVIEMVKFISRVGAI